jgi:hypothetical protein
MSADAPIAEQGRELFGLELVHGFYLSVLDQYQLERPPIPAEVCGEDGQPVKVEALKRWLRVLDLAVRFPMLRDAMVPETPRETAAALLQYFMAKPAQDDGDRDKVDFIVTFLYRKNSGAKLGMPPSEVEISTFECELRDLLADKFPELPRELQHLVKEFEFFSQEVADFKVFEQITDSGIVQRVRSTKECFGAALYHPRALAAVAVHNAFFGERFDSLFKKAVEEVRSFAQEVLDAGASIESKVAGDIRVRHLTEVEHEKLHREEYVRAQLDLRKVARLRKAVDSQKRAKSPAERRQANQPLTAAQYLEESKIRAAEDMVRLYLDAANARDCHMVPIQRGNVGLSKAEVDAFRTPHKDEKSFRASFAALLRRCVAINTRMRNELGEYFEKRRTQYLWKPHADALVYLLSVGSRAVEASCELRRTAEERGLLQKIKELEISIDRMRAQMAQVAQALQQ